METTPQAEVDLFGHVIEQMPPSHEWTLELVRARKPEVYRAVVAMLACQVPVRHICEQLGVSDHTVALIRTVDAAAVATQTRAYAERLRCQSAQAFAHAMSVMCDANARDAANAAKAMLESSQLLMGQPTEIAHVQKIEVDLDPRRVAARIRELAIEVETVPSPASDSGSEAQDAQVPVVAVPAAPACGTDTDLATTEPAEPARPATAADRAGGGVGSRAGQAEAMGSASPKI